MDCRDSSNRGKPLIIIGASARAAAQSATRRGRLPLPIDLFADADLCQDTPTCMRVPADLYPGDLPDMAQTVPPTSFVITGGLENRPDIVQAIEARHHNEGTLARDLEPVRDPWQVRAVLTEVDMQTPDLAATCPDLRDGQRWLRKPRGGCGGRDIRPASVTDADDAPETQSVYFQEFVPGQPCSAVYERHRDRVELLGVTEQIVGETALGARPFAYCGSVGPLDLDQASRHAFERIGKALAESFRLRGLFGVDAILRDGVPVPIEVNPRYTASVEVLEIAREQSGSFAKLGKAVLFAREETQVVDDLLPERLRCGSRDRAGRLGLADIPAPGTRVDEGHPILTCFASAETADRCRQLLLEYARDLYERLELRTTPRKEQTS